MPLGLHNFIFTIIYFRTFSSISKCVDKKLYNCKPAEWNSVAKFTATFSSICFDEFQGTISDSTNVHKEVLKF